MFTIKKTGEGSYLVSLNGQKKDLGHIECHTLKKEVTPILKPHKEITVNIEGVKTIDDRGFHILNELMNVARKSRCNIQFFNIDPDLLTKISSLTQKVNFTHKEVEYE